MNRHSAKFCPACGHPTSPAFVHGRMRPHCESCGNTVYFDPKVSVVLFAVQAEKVLLVQRDIEPGFGKWSLPGGFVDVDEHPQEAARRELLEETGLEAEIGPVIDVFYNQAEGSVINIVYAATPNGGELHAGDDAANAVWFTRETLPELVFTSTITLVSRWQAEKA